MAAPIFDHFPPELIADEYLRHNKDNRILYIFYDTNHQQYTDYYKNIFENETCRCAKMFEITTKKRVKDHIDYIINEHNHDAKDCFMLVFLGSLKNNNKPDEYNTEDNDDPIKGIDIWKPFANSPNFVYRPKIFIFHAFQEVKMHIDLDERPFQQPLATYEIPRESDVLIVYKETKNFISDCRIIPYFTELSKNLKEYGHRDDLVNIFTYTKCGDDGDFHPLIVSTLRKKVYVTSSEYRSHWYDTSKQMNEYFEILQLLGQTIHKYVDSKKISDLPKKQQNRNGSVIVIFLSVFFS